MLHGWMLSVGLLAVPMQFISTFPFIFCRLWAGCGCTWGWPPDKCVSPVYDSVDICRYYASGRGISACPRCCRWHWRETPKE